LLVRRIGKYGGLGSFVAVTNECADARGLQGLAFEQQAAVTAAAAAAAAVAAAAAAIQKVRHNQVVWTNC
jgi:hypothetical protein